jgi:hypothetical protein
MTFYIDEIEAVYKAEDESEQTGLEIATFENGNLYNVIDTPKKAVSTFEIAENALGSTGKSLKVKTNVGGGFQYLFDKKIKNEELLSQDFMFKLGLPENANVSSVSISFITDLGTQKAFKTIDLSKAEKGETLPASLKITRKDTGRTLHGSLTVTPKFHYFGK